jgi:hypothetical protein
MGPLESAQISAVRSRAGHSKELVIGAVCRAPIGIHEASSAFPWQPYRRRKSTYPHRDGVTNGLDGLPLRPEALRFTCLPGSRGARALRSPQKSLAWGERGAAPVDGALALDAAGKARSRWAKALGGWSPSARTRGGVHAALSSLHSRRSGVCTAPRRCGRTRSCLPRLSAMSLLRSS